MTNLKDLYDIIDYIDENNFNINILNIFLDFKGEDYLNKFQELIEKFVKINIFDDLEKIFDKEYLQYKKSIKYVKIYYLLKKNNQNIIFFNPELYKDLIIEDIFQNYDKNIFENNNNTLVYKIEKENEKTRKLLNFLINQDNFINNFIKKQNTKTFIYSKIWKNDLLQNQEKFNLNSLNFKNNTSTKVVKELKKYKIKKKQTIEFNIIEEKITTSIRLSLPNTFIFCFEDLSFIQLNKIVVSKTLNFNNIKFINFKEKIKYLLNIYRILFDIDIEKININFNITIKKENEKKLRYSEIIHKIDRTKILFNEKNINIKYIKNMNELKENLDILKLYEEKNIEKKKKFLTFNFNRYLLYLKDDEMEKYFQF